MATPIIGYDPYAMDIEERDGSFFYRLYDGSDNLILEHESGSAWTSNEESLQAMGETLIMLYRESLGLTDPKDEIVIKWTVWDVRSEDVRPDLTLEQARDVLACVKRNHDAEIGVNWDVIRATADSLYPEPDEQENTNEI